MSVLQEHLEQSIRERRLFGQGQGILVAVSGGLDSMVLMHALRALSVRHGWRLAVAHLNHQLRGRSSEADERLVRQTARKLKLRLVVEREDVREQARTDRLSLEMAARKARHEFLARVARRLGIRTIALAHHADDQVELFFLRLLRGAGGEGLAGMSWRNPSPADARVELVRPQLDQPKAALRKYAVERGIRFREDASNRCLEIQRNRIRHELLPLLRKNFQPALARTVLRVMEIVGAEAEFVSQAALEWLGKRQGSKRRTSKPGQATVESVSTPFDDLPLAVQRRSLQLQLVNLGIAPDFGLVEQLRVAAGRPVSVSPRTFADGGGGMPPTRESGANPGLAPRFGLRDARGVVHLLPPSRDGFNPALMDLELKGRAGEVVFEGARISWRVSKADWKSAVWRKPGREVFDADKVGSRIRLRHWQRGDRFQPIGMPGGVKLQDILTNQKVPRARRHELIVAATASGEVFWVEGLRISERFKLTETTIRGLHWRWERL